MLPSWSLSVLWTVNGVASAPFAPASPLSPLAPFGIVTFLPSENVTSTSPFAKGCVL
ncbi:hypothetical protein [Staphylococcus carnosus]|uniref:hypothetical protein n=1 Tax=Staphylococcus carnosus TaxID=1281 RepID=UPI001197E7A0|nr:hypothetical protein [Staphylococcus carnosus]QQS84246.1 hypothetical protein I6J04_07380 [Staphylococcus carnosus]QRQ04189.1 hypothetical protein I6J34_07785 [Staphylococcus carnosus]GEP78985.1 hypothetical protein SCA05_07780 [Staphylococcus carnosus]